MEEPLTEKLLEELLSAPSAECFIEQAAPNTRTLSEYLQQLLEEKNVKRSEVIRAAGLNETFGYQIFTGARNASRNKVLQLAFAFPLSLRETNRLLQAAGPMNCTAKTVVMPLSFFRSIRAIRCIKQTRNCIALKRKLFVRSKWYKNVRGTV